MAKAGVAACVVPSWRVSGKRPNSVGVARVRIDEVIPWKRFGEWRLSHLKRAHSVAGSMPGGVALPLPEGDFMPGLQAQDHPLHPTNNTIWVTVLVENSVVGRQLQAEHGWSCFIRIGTHSLVFDVGQSGLLVQNAERLGIDLAGVEAIVLSHGHYDHTGGLPALRAMAPRAQLFLHPAALLPKFAGDVNGNSRPVGPPEAARQALSATDQNVVLTTTVTRVLEDVFVTGEIPRSTSFEPASPAFFLDEGCCLPDPLTDDQALFFDTKDGLVVLLGCAHAGVVNTLEHILHVRPGRPIHAVIGGMHLLDAEPTRVDQTLARFRALDIQRLGPAHCTGIFPTARIRTEFPDRSVVCAVGSSMVFHRCT